jgi:hypothetical protein
MIVKSPKQKTSKAIKRATKKGIKFYKNLLVLIFIMIIIYTIVISIWTFINVGTDFLANVVTISVGGFWAFFLGYFGWRMGETIEKYFKNIKPKD